MDYQVKAYRVSINGIIDIKPGTIAGNFVQAGQPNVNINSELYYICLEPVIDLSLADSAKAADEAAEEAAAAAKRDSPA